MPVNTIHPEYLANLDAWTRARDVLRGEDAIKAAGERYLPRLEMQSDAEYAAYRARAAFFNATARTADGFLGLVFRRPPFIKLPPPASPLGKLLACFAQDTDLLGATLEHYAKDIVREVIAVGRAGTLVDWEDQCERRVYLARYAAENILNWRVERVHGRNTLTMVVLHEPSGASIENPHDEFAPLQTEQIRVLKLVPQPALDGQPTTACQVEIWRQQPAASPLSPSSTLHSPSSPPSWSLAERRTPLRLGRPLPLIPFVFHGPRHALPEVDKLPLADMIAVNLDHYRLDADYKHGMHYTAMPTAWVSGFDKNATLRIGAQTAWVADQAGAAAGFLEYKGEGLGTFERALDRDERLMAVLGSRLLENQKRVGETAEAIELRQSGEDCVLAGLARSVSASLTQVLRWACWWYSTETFPEQITSQQVSLNLNADFSTKGLSPQELEAIIASWQSKALSRDSMLELLRRGEILPDGRTNAEEIQLIDHNH